MTTFVHVGDAITFSANNGVMLNQEALSLSPNELRDAVAIAFEHVKNPVLVDSCCGGCGPLAEYSDISFEEYLQVLEEERIRQATIEAKRGFTRQRRSQFGAKRAQLILAMIEAGISHVCAHPDCRIAEKLTIDHIVPLSRGGSDEVRNLQFLCVSHNSAKGDQVQP